MKQSFDAKYYLYLLTLFDGKISITEILNMDIPLLLEMRQAKEIELERQSRQLDKELNSKK